MTQFYNKADQKRTLLSKRFLFTLICCLGIFGSLMAQNVNVTGSIGPSAGTYPTLKAAFDAINAGTHQGAITVTIVLNTTEAATAVLNSSSVPSNYSSVTITAGGVGLPRIVTGNLASAIVKLNGADNVTIGAGPTNDLTFSNTSNSTTSGVLWVASASSSDGATNNLIQYCNITGSGATNTLVGIAQCSGTTLGGLAETANSNNTYLHNTVTASQFGIGVVGATGNQDNQTVISSNTVNTLGRSGIFVSTQKNVLVTQNDIFGVNSNLGNFTIQNTGIYVVGAITNGLIERNKIHNIRISSFWGCSGIQLDANNTGTGLTIANNFIWDISAGGWLDFDTVDDNACGIAVDAGTGYNIYYNTIDLDPSANQPSAGTFNAPTACLWITSPGATTPSPTALNVRNNSFSNRETTGRVLSVWTYSTNTIFTAIDYNNYYSAGANLGFLVTSQANLCNWVTATGKDLNSVAILPAITSASDLHIVTTPVASTSPLNHLATPIAGITTDFDGGARDATRPDIGADEFTPVACGGNTAGTISACQTSFCASGSTIIIGSGFALGEGMTYQWQSSTTSSSGPWAPASGTNTNPLHYNTGTLLTTTYYQLMVQCGAGPQAAAGPVTITVNNPSVTAGPTVSRCGSGTVNLTATGSNLTWYAASTGGNPIGAGSPFTTPLITSTTNFWVSASTVGTTTSGGKASTTGADGGSNATGSGLRFDVTTPFRLVSVRMYPQAAGHVDITAFNSAGTSLGSTGADFTGPVPGGVVVSLPFSFAIGNNYTLQLTGNTSSISIWRDVNGLTFPYNLAGAGNITNGWQAGVAAPIYFYFYDWQISTNTCESLRVPVTAQVNAPPAFATETPSSAICQGGSVTLNATGGGYSTVVWNPGNLPNGSIVSPTVTTTYTVTGQIPPVGTGCRRDDIITITVNTTPTAISITPSTLSLCPNLSTSVTVTGGLIPNQSIFSETAEVFPFTQFTQTGNLASVSQNTTYAQQGTGSIHLINQDFTSTGSIESGNIALTGFSNPSLTFYHIAALESSGGNHYDVGYVEYSTNGGGTWTKFPVSSYTVGGTLVSQITDGPVAGVGFDRTSYPDWNAQFNGTGATPGTVAASASLWKHETIDLSTWAGMPTFKIRFRIMADVSLHYYGWLIDSISIKGTGQAPITWTSNPNIFQTAPPSPGPPTTPIPVNSGNWPTVWYWVNANTPAYTYTAVATGGVGCTSTTTVTISASSATPSVTITASPGTTVCDSVPVTFTAIPVNGGTGAGYNWKVNGNPAVIGGSQVGLSVLTIPSAASTAHTGYLANGDLVTCAMSVAPNFCFPGGTIVTSNTLTMTVNPKPVANPITGGNTVCIGSTTNLLETPGGAVTSYQWYTVTGSGPFTYSPVGPNANTYGITTAANYAVAVTTAAGCKDTSNILPVTLPTYTITVTPGPNGDITPAGPYVVNCGAQPAFNIVPNPGYAILDVSVNGTSVGTPSSYTFQPMHGDSTISATFWFPGCATPATANAGPDNSICSGLSYTLAGTSIGGPATTATWSTTGTGTFSPSTTWTSPAGTTYIPSAADSAAGSVTITLTTDDPPGACPASSASMTLTIKPSPYVSIVGIPGICASGATTHWLTGDTSATNVNVTGFQWYHPFPTAIGGATNDSLNINATGNYTVVVTGTNGCTASSAINSTVLTAPSVTASGLGPICTDASVDITATAVAGSGTIVSNGYQWYNGGPIAGGNFQIYSATTAGSYQVTATNSNGCVSPLSTPAVNLALASGPLNGVYTIGAGPASCTNYISFDKACNDLNTRGISGNCIFNVVAGYTEVVPAAGLKLGSALLNGSTSPSGTNYSIRFAKSGPGANPLLTAYTGGNGTPATAVPDGIWNLNGVDNVTINQIDFAENAANGAANTAMEYAIGLFKLSVTDGCQYNTIQNCNISLNKANAVAGAGTMMDGSTAILVVNATSINAINALVPTTSGGTNSNNKFYNNDISNCHQGFGFWGYAASSPFTLADTNNDIGGTSPATANTIVNFGNSGDATAPSGVRILNQYGINVSFNTMINNNGSGSNTTNELRGIWAPLAPNASATMSGNTITLTSAAPSGQQMIGIDNNIGGGGGGNSILISDNIIGITTTTATTANMIGIQNLGTATASTINIVNNTVQNCSLTGTGTFTGISNAAAGTVPIPITLNISSNSVIGNTKTGTGNMNLISTGGPTTATINDNILRNNVVTGGAAAVNLNCIAGSTSNYTLDGNIINNNGVTNMTIAAIATINAYINIASPVQETITDNVIGKLFIGGTSTGLQIIRGIYNNTINGGTHFRIVARNTIDSLYTSATQSATIVGIWSQVGFDVTISKNKITRLWPGQSATLGSFAQGIRIQSGTTIKVSNNIIGLDLTQGSNNGVLKDATSVSGIEVVGMAAAGSVANLYYNTIRIAGAGSGTSFGTSGISISSTTNSNGTVTMKDNLVANFATPGGVGAGVSAALRKAGGTTYGTTSNNNLWYTTQTATTPIYYVAAPTATLAAFKALVTPRETASIGDLPIFVNAAQNDLHLDPSNNCNIDGAGTPIATYVDDYDTDPRDAVTPDIGMDEFSGTGTGFTWKGYNTDWLNPANWCGGVPTAASDVVIPAGKTFYPIITNTLPVAHNININVGGSITINAAGTLSNTGSWTNDGTLTNNGTIVLNGTVNQSFPGGGAGTIPFMNNLTAGNTGGVTINKPLTMIGNLNPKVGNLSVNDVITLHSDASGTAFVDTVLGTISYSGPGKFVVERFISTTTSAPPANFYVGWRYLAAPITGTQTINQAWQEGEVAPTYTANGYGTQIVGPGGPAQGYDVANTLPSIKKYDPVTNTYTTLPGTNGTNFISATDGYMIFIRGDRGANTFGAHNPTTLRMSGPIKTGNVTLSTATINQFIPVGNPYPCAVSFTSMAKTNLQDFYYIWDPKIGTYGVWQVFSGPLYNPSTLGGSYVNGQSNIESGMAFMVKANGTVGAHSLQITESCKRTGSFNVARVNTIEKQLRTRLLGAVNNPMVYDGNRVDFDAAYSNTVDDNDAEKLTNFGENLGLVRNGNSIAIERRAEIVDTDTIFFKMDKMKVQDYQLEFTAENLASPVLTAYLEDAFLNSRTQIDLNSVITVPFSVTADPLSKAADRFRIVFKQQGIVPLSFISVKAFRQDNNIMVNWTVANEANIAQYEIQHSADGRNFSQLGTQAARNINGVGSQQYDLLDVQPFSGDNFYRIKSVNNSGEIKYSQVVKVNMKGDPSTITVYPNPVKEDGIVAVSMMNEPKGVYKVNLINTLGQVVLTRTINHDGGNSVYSIELNGSLAHGTYQLQVAEGNKVKTTIKILY